MPTLGTVEWIMIGITFAAIVIVVWYMFIKPWQDGTIDKDTDL